MPSCKLTLKKVEKLKNGASYCRVHGLPAYAGYEGPRIGDLYFYAKRCWKGNYRDEQTNLPVVNGSSGNQYFRKLSAAQRFVDEIHAGMHPWIAMHSEHFHAEFDEFDRANAESADRWDEDDDQ